MSDKIIYKFGDVMGGDDITNLESIESRGYKKAVKSFQVKYPKLKNVYVTWDKEGVELTKLQKLPIGRKKKLG
jgi:hypothetical protein